MWKEEERYKDKEREGRWQLIKGKRGRKKERIKWHRQKRRKKETWLHRQKEKESTRKAVEEI
jgi:hypothetical protein